MGLKKQKTHSSETRSEQYKNDVNYPSLKEGVSLANKMNFFYIMKEQKKRWIF